MEKASFEELRHVLGWLREKNDRPDRIPGVLVGGWAVYAYNPYLGNIDIDLVTTGRMRKSLCHWLIEDRQFEAWRTREVGWEGVRKRGPEGIGEDVTPYGNWIIADFASRNEHYAFEGTDQHLDFDVLDGHTVEWEIEGIRAVIPERALLVLLKLKAAHDRGTRIGMGTSENPRWEGYKQVKDLADVLALLDPDAGGDDLSVRFLASRLAQFPFLVRVLREAGRSEPAIERYGRLAPKEAAARIDGLLDVLT